MDIVTVKALVAGLQEEVDCVVPVVTIELSDSEEAKVIKTITWTETL